MVDDATTIGAAASLAYSKQQFTHRPVQDTNEVVPTSEFDSEWITVVKRRPRGMKVSKVQQDEDVSDVTDLVGDLSFGDNFLLSTKESSRLKFERSKLTNGARDNFKERRKAKRRKWRKVQPHADEVEVEDCEDSHVDFVERDRKQEAVRQAKVKMRNNFARAAVETETLNCDDDSSELSDLLSSIQVPSSLEDDPDVAGWLSYLENLVILGYQISRAKSFMDVFVATVGYIKMHTQKSVIKEILSVIDTLSETPDGDDIEPHAMLDANDIMRKWDLFKNNTIFTKVSYLITAAMSLTVCSVKSIEWSPLGLKLVSLEAARSQLAAVDVIDALISTFTWLAETGYRVFQEKSLMPLLYSDARMQKFNVDCDYVIAHSEQVLAGNGECVQDFEYKCDDVLRQVSELKAVKNTGPTATWLQARYSQLVDIKYKIVAKHRNTAIRFAPFGVGLTGPSGVGKSTLSKLVMKTSLHAMGFETDSKRVITKDMFDKYDSTYTSDILGMFMDDVGNGKSQFAQVSPTDVIIKFFNNMAAQAVKAELNAKGVVFIAFKVGVLTSNFKDYQVRCYTNKPEAALRRFVHTRVHVKEKYRVPGGISLNTDHPDLQNCGLCHDVWSLSLEECFVYETGGGTEAYKFRIMDVKLPDGRVIYCKDLDLPTYLDVIIALAKKHKIKQESVVEKSRQFDVMAMCDTCCRPQPMCTCKTEPHSMLADVMMDAASSAVQGYFSQWFQPIVFFDRLCGFRPVRKMATRHIAGEISDILNRSVTPFAVAMTPEWVFQTSVFQKSIELWQHSAVTYDLRKHMKFVSVFGVFLLFYNCCRRQWTTLFWSALLLWLIKIIMWSQYRSRMRLYQQEYLERRDALPSFAKSVRDSHVVKGAVVVSSLLVGLKLFQLWNKARLEPNSGDKSDDDNNLTKEEMEKSPGWFGFMMNRLGVSVDVSESSKRAHPSHVASTLQKSNVFWAEFTRDDGSVCRCNIFFPRKGVAWFPEHLFHKDSNLELPACKSMEVKVYRHMGPGGIFSFKTERSFAVSKPELDLVSVFVPNCPDLRSKVKWLPLSKPSGVSTCTLLVRSEDEFKTDKINVEHGVVGHKYKSFYGGSYNTKLAQKGACMGPLILEQKNPVIVGFHIGGNPTINYGVMQTITQEVAQELIDGLEDIPGVILSSEAVDLPETQYGRKIIDKKEVHPQSMAARLKREDFVDVLGSTKLRSVQKSTVRKSVISDHVEKVTGVKNKWGPPKLKPNWRGFNATLEHIVNPTKQFNPSAVEKARQDWLKPLLPLMEEYSVIEELRPLTLKEAIMGVPGKRFLDPLDMATGMGFPVFGPKSRHFTDVYENGVLVDRKPSAEVMEELTRIHECWERGERAYPISCATLKDEPTEEDSDKVRVFEASAIAMSIWIRKYFLPIVRFISLHPLQAESAVGVNAFSQQWEKIMNHATKYAPDGKTILWDYSKYDVRMSSQMVVAVIASLIDLATCGKYQVKHIRIMRAMSNDMAHPTIDYNGVLLQCYNMNPSGNPITVYINSIAGSLYVRLGFFNEFPEEDDFRSCVAAITYGDDFFGSVLEEYRRFNFYTYKEFLAKTGMKITLPDKSDDEVCFMDIKDSDFLKRKSNFIPEIGHSIGKLDENSIFKSLHANLASKSCLPEEVSSSCIETAMHEWFAHGRELYNVRAEQMREVCDLADLPVPAVHVTFDERVRNWQNKYT